MLARKHRALGVRRTAPRNDGQAGDLARRRLGDAEAQALPLQLAPRLQRQGQRGRQGGGPRILATGVHRSLLLEAVDRHRPAGDSGVAVHRDHPHRAGVRAQPLLPAGRHRRQPTPLHRPHRLHRGRERGVHPQDHRRRSRLGVWPDQPGELRPLQGERGGRRLQGDADSGAFRRRRGRGPEPEPPRRVEGGVVPGRPLPARSVTGHQPRRGERAGVLRPVDRAAGGRAVGAQLLPGRMGQRGPATTRTSTATRYQDGFRRAPGGEDGATRGPATTRTRPTPCSTRSA